MKPIGYHSASAPYLATRPATPRNDAADDIEWVQPGDSAISGTYHGKAEVVEYLGRLAEKSVTVKLNRLLADGDTVVALTDVAVGDEKGQDADVFTLRDGKTVRVQVHTDTAVMERVYGKKQLAAG